MRDRFLPPLLLLVALFLAACGSVADPKPTFAPTNTALPRAANLPDETAQAEDSGEVVAIQATAIPATATPLPSPTLVPTLAPTEIPTEVATEAPTEAEADSGVVVVNGIEGDAEFGESWFNGAVKVTYNNVEWQCSTCHNPNERIPGSGPYLYGIATVAGERNPNMTAIEYLADSILNPNSHIAPTQIGPDGTEYPWAEGVMPDNWGTVLDEFALADLVAYLMTLDQPLD
jgi:mono/diheme cytochrome c family protein